MVVVLGCDHAGVELKNKIKQHIEGQGFETIDVGTFDNASCDYPDFAIAAAKKIKDGFAQKGILICGTGIGISISANKMKGIRCALCHDLFSAEMTRLHNDSNMLAMGARVVDSDLACIIADTFLTTNFEGGRHQNRVDKMMAIEKIED